MREYLLVFLVAGAVTYLLGVIAREIALRTGAVAQVRDRDVHVIPIPYFGGLAMLGGLLAAFVVAQSLPFLSARAPENVYDDLGVVLVAGALICAVGVLDDLIELDPLMKLGGQVAAAGFLVLNGVHLYFIPVPGGGQMPLHPVQAQLISIVLVVATVNAVNFVDGLDGLAAGVVGLGAGAFFLFSYTLAAANSLPLAITSALLCASLMGACAGFLPHNFWPARIFMGDSGSMLIGLVLASSALTLTGQFPPGSLTQGADGGEASLSLVLVPVLLPIAILVVPLADLVLAVVRRTAAGSSPFTADKKHLHHRLLEIGHSQRRAVLIMWLWAALIALGSVLLGLYSGWITWGFVALWLVVTVIATFWLPRVHTQHHPV